MRTLEEVVLSLTETVCDYQLMVEIDDPSINCNGTINRIWSIRDLCSESPIAIPFDTQQVVLLDTIIPLIVCTAFNSLENRETIALNPTACAATIAFPLPTATDNCTTQPLVSEFSVETLSNNSWTKIANTLADISFSRGIYRVGYTAVDDCRNTTNVTDCYRYFEVIDNTFPIAACLPNVVVQLENNGTAIVTSEAFNGNSTDNCSIANITIRRTTCDPTESPAESVSTTGTFGEFSTQITFDCCDIGKTVLVEMRVEDESGNVNICQTQVSQIEANDTDIFNFIEPALSLIHI